MMKNILEALNAVDTKLDSPEKWTQFYYAVDSKGKQVSEVSDDACAWCLDGAVISVSNNPVYSGLADQIGHDTLIFLGKIIVEETNFSPRHVWNDEPGRTFQDVKNILKIAKQRILDNYQVSCDETIPE